MCFLVLAHCSRTLYSQSRVTNPVRIGPVPDIIIEVSSKGGGGIFSACSETNVKDPDPQQIKKHDPDQFINLQMTSQNVRDMSYLSTFSSKVLSLYLEARKLGSASE